MRWNALFCAVVVLFVECLAAAQAADKDKPNVQTMPPVVVKTVPESGDAKVDPSLTEIQVTFCKKMKDGTWSWSSAFEKSEPKITGKPHYLEDGKTCALPVQLEPGKTYGFWINSQKFGNFKDADGRSSVPYLLIFETAKKETSSSQKE
jgi:RNA polymerase sigma-70 factor (ECF subfamily)